MKTKLFLLAHLAFLLLPLSLYPQGFSYQAVLRDASGQVLASQQAGFRISLLQGSEEGAAVYVETHQQTSTPQGSVTLTIGNGSVVSGNFSVINWADGPYFLKVEADPQGGSAYSISEVKPLHWVPYAKLSETSESISAGKLEVKGDASQNDEEALFEVKRNDGQTVFAVYPDGVRIYVEDLPDKGSKGGFAVGGFDPAKGLTGEYLRVTPDSVRIYLDDADGKGSKGGFAVGGFDPSKGITDEFMRVTGDSTRVYVKNQGKGSKGGFAVGGFDPSKNLEFNYLDLTPQNYFIGHSAGKNITLGLYNSFIGYESGYNTDIGSLNAFFGYKSGYNNTSGESNLFMGYWSGYSNSAGSFNTFVGYRAGAYNTTGGENTFIGSYTGSNNTTGSLNSFVGYYTGFQNTTGSANSFFGNYAGYANTEGFSNVFLGNKAGYNNIGGVSSVYIGDSTGYNNTYGSSNVYLGHLAGYNANNDFSNVFIGYKSGYSTTVSYSNVFIGNSTGRLTTWGSQNVYIGDGAGEKNATGSTNVAIGVAAGGKSSASSNVFLGYAAGVDNTSGASNVFIGNQAGWSNTTGANNIFIGSQTGYTNSGGNGNIFIGRQSGWNETGSNKLYIDNSNTSTPLIHGDFSTDVLTINGRLDGNQNIRIVTNPGTASLPAAYLYQGGTGSTTKANALAIRDALWVTGPSWFGGTLNVEPTGIALTVGGDEALWYNGTYFSWGYGGTYNYFADRLTIGNITGSGSYMLYVQGSAYATGTWSGSDARYKKDIKKIESPIDKVIGMKGVSYEWRTNEFQEKNFPEGRHYGVIAQEIAEVVPEIVRETPEGEKAVAYNEIIPVLIEAIKEQQAVIEGLKARLEKLESDK